MKLKPSGSIEHKKLITALLAQADQQTKANWAADCAAHVLAYFTTQNPDDHRPEKAIEAARAWARGEMTMHEARTTALASHAAARDTNDVAACAAARSAGHAAATAHVATHAIHASVYAAKAVACKRMDITVEQNWQLQRFYFLISDLKNKNN